jgi:hypothetical protein
MQSIHIRGAYLNVSGSKTANYAPASYAEHTNFGARRNASGNVSAIALPASPPSHNQVYELHPTYRTA